MNTFNLGVEVSEGSESKAAAIQMELYLDIQCPYSKKAWNNIKPLLKELSGKMSCVLYLTSLPLHYNAFLASQFAYIVLHDKGKEAFLKFLEGCFNVQESFFNAATIDKTRHEVAMIFCKIVRNFWEISDKDLMEKVTNWEYTKAIYKEWQYAVTRGITGTPKFIVNGFLVAQAESSWDVAAWKQFFGDPT